MMTLKSLKGSFCIGMFIIILILLPAQQFKWAKAEVPNYQGNAPRDSSNGVIHEDRGFQSFIESARASDSAATECISTEQRAEIERKIEQYEAGLGASINSVIGPEPYPFFPQAGLPWVDLSLVNFVDLDPSFGIMDWSCGGRTYDGHTGIDSGLRSFREQDIGVPVFAALDGTVVEARDDAFDRNVSGQNAPLNLVVLNHGNGHTTWYLHLRRNSVPVRLNQTVRAGTQIGLTGSSGLSTGPHLHFESKYNGVTYEPFAGPCRPGQSNWVNQLPIRKELYLTNMAFSNAPFIGIAAAPYDEAVRVNSFLPGFRRIFYRADFANVPAAVPYTIRILRPNGAEYGRFSASTGPLFQRVAQAAWFFDLNLDTIGTWVVQLSIGQFYSEGYFRVVASPSEIINHAPFDIVTVINLPAPRADDVFFCIVLPTTGYPDPDYDVVSYNYRWSINGLLVRDVTSAALTDTIPKGTARPGDRVTCTVRPYDGKVFGRTAESSVTIAGGVAPSIDSGTFDGKKKLAISGQGFSASPKVFINGAEKTDRISISSDTSVKLKGKKSALGLRSGENTIQVFHASGVGSNFYKLRL